MQELKPTRRQKKLITGLGLDPKEWHIVRNRQPGKIVLVHKETGVIRELAV